MLPSEDSHDHFNGKRATTTATTGHWPASRPHCPGCPQPPAGAEHSGLSTWMGWRASLWSAVSALRDHPPTWNLLVERETGPPEVHIPGLTGSVLSRATVSASTSSVPGRPWARQLGYESRPCHLLAVTPQASLPVPGPTQRAGERLMGGSVYSVQSARPATARGWLELRLEHPPAP